MTSESVIRVEGLGKLYRIGRLQSYRTLRESVGQAFSAPFRRLAGVFRPGGAPTARRGDTIWALKDVSFEVQKGEALGIVGRNGAGKSTLLKILSRITQPTEGCAEIRGRVGSLLEVGTGFHPELTGRENLYLNGAILGMKRAQIARKFDEIVAFAEVEKFVDTPVKYYSTGMYLRLAFSVAAHLESDVLLIDEVLAVGDAFFQKKCLGKMGDIARAGRTVLFVSHQLDMMRSLCDRCILLEGGSVARSGTPGEVVEYYVASIRSSSTISLFEAADDERLRVQITRGRVLDELEHERDRFDVFDRVRLEFEYTIRRPVEGAVVNFELKRSGSVLFMSFDTDADPGRLALRQPGTYRAHVELPCPLLKPGRYSICTNTGIANTSTFQHLEDVLVFDVDLLSKSSAFVSYAGKRPGVVAVPLEWRTEVVERGSADRDTQRG